MSELIEFDELAAKITVFVQPTLTIEVDSPESAAAAMGVARQIKTYEKLVEAKRQELNAPLLERTRMINARVKQIQEPLEKAERHIKSQLIAQEQRLAAERAIAAKKLAEAKAIDEAGIAAREEEAKATAALFGAPVENDDAAVERKELEESVAKHEKDIAAHRVSGTSKIWKVEIVEQALVPREYCDPVMTLLRDAVKRGVREIPGCRIFLEDRIAIR